MYSGIGRMRKGEGDFGGLMFRLKNRCVDCVFYGEGGGEYRVEVFIYF